MRKLIGKWKYSIGEDCKATIYGCLKGTAKYIPAFICHSSCIDVIIKDGNFNNPNVVLKPINKEA